MTYTYIHVKRASLDLVRAFRIIQHTFEEHGTYRNLTVMSICVVQFVMLHLYQRQKSVFKHDVNVLIGLTDNNVVPLLFVVLETVETVEKCIYNLLTHTTYSAHL